MDKYLHDGFSSIWISEIKLCEDSRVVCLDKKIKTDKFKIVKFVKLENYLRENLSQISLAVLNHPRIISFIINKNLVNDWFTVFKLCMIAITAKPELLQEINLSLLRERNFMPLVYIQNICNLAVRLDPKTLQYVPKQFQTHELCCNAAGDDPRSIYHIKDRFRQINISTSLLTIGGIFCVGFVVSSVNCGKQIDKLVQSLLSLSRR